MCGLKNLWKGGTESNKFRWDRKRQQKLSFVYFVILLAIIHSLLPHFWFQCTKIRPHYLWRRKSKILEFNRVLLFFSFCMCVFFFCCASSCFVRLNWIWFFVIIRGGWIFVAMSLSLYIRREFCHSVNLCQYKSI